MALSSPHHTITRGGPSVRTVIWIFVVVSALVAFVVAAVAVGSVTAAQAGKSRPAVYDLNDAVDHVADHLPALIAYIDGNGRYGFANRACRAWSVLSAPWK